MNLRPALAPFTRCSFVRLGASAQCFRKLKITLICSFLTQSCDIGAQTVVSRSWDQLKANEGVSEDHVRVLHRQERVPQVVERVVYEEVSASRENNKQNHLMGPKTHRRQTNESYHIPHTNWCIQI